MAESPLGLRSSGGQSPTPSSGHQIRGDCRREGRHSGGSFVQCLERAGFGGEEWCVHARVGRVSCGGVVWFWMREMMAAVRRTDGGVRDAGVVEVEGVANDLVKVSQS